MSERDVILEALSILCNANITFCQAGGGSNLPITGFLSTLMGRSALHSVLRGPIVIDEKEFFDPHYDYDFTHLKDTETYYRGDEVYERPCGWKRYALKVLDKYPDGNAWLGERGRCTTTGSKAGEWPVSYHGTSKNGAHGIIISQFKPGPGQVYGRGIYSTPYISEALPYTKSFTSASTGCNYQVVLQNRVNPAYREKHYNGKYWLVPIPKGISEQQEVEIVEKAIRPYALLLKQV